MKGSPLSGVLLWPVVAPCRGNNDLPGVGASASKRPGFDGVLVGEVTLKAVDSPPGMLGVRGMGVRGLVVLLGMA